MRYDNIPDEIRTLNQWVCAHSDSKAPQQALSHFPASSTNPTTWTTFEEAVSSVNQGFHDHIGFVFNDTDMVGIDIDSGYDEGFISPLAADIINKCHSYTEKSKSGRGFHILLKGNLPFKGKNNRNGVEIYKTARFFIMTGDVLIYRKIIDNQDAIDYVVDKYFPEMRENSSTGTTPRIYTPAWDKPTNNKIRLRPIYDTIPDGMRNISLTSLAGQLHNLGYDRKAIYQELSYVNKVACKPPLIDNEISIIVNSVTKYRR